MHTLETDSTRMESPHHYSYPKQWSSNKHHTYPSIGLLCSISKVPEKVLFDAIYIHIIPNISLNQFGFVKGCSCPQRIPITLMLTCINCRTHTTIDAIYLDFRIGFDSVSHEELWNIGITGSLWILLKDYLTNICQLTSIDDVT